MIIIQMSSNYAVYVTRESINGVIYSLLPDGYHNYGIGTEFPNHDTIRGHTFSVKTGEYPAGVPILLEFRGIEAFERSLEYALSQIDSIRIKDVLVQIDQVYSVNVPSSRQYKTGKPILTRISTDRPEAKPLVRPGQKSAYLTYNDNPSLWIEVIQYNLKRRGQALMGDAFVEGHGEPVIKVLNADISRDRLEIKNNNLIVRGTNAVLEITDGAWADVAFRIGLGEKCTYGFGVLKAQAAQHRVIAKAK